MDGRVRDGTPFISDSCYRMKCMRYDVWCRLTLKAVMSHTRGADKSLARPTSRCILFDGENILFDASLVLYIYIYILLIFLQL